jgi:hypothetical protein
VALGLVGTPLMLLDRFDRLPVLLGGGLLLVLLELAWQLTLRRGSPRAPRPAGPWWSPACWPCWSPPGASA